MNLTNFIWLSDSFEQSLKKDTSHLLTHFIRPSDRRRYACMVVFLILGLNKKRLAGA